VPRSLRQRSGWVLIAVVVFATVGLQLASRSVARQIVAAVAATTGAEVKYRGSRWRLGGDPGVVLSDFRVRGTGADLGEMVGAPMMAGVAYDLNCSRVEVICRWSDLVGGNLNFSRVRLAGPSFMISGATDTVVCRGFDFACEALAPDWTALRLAGEIAQVEVPGISGDQVLVTATVQLPGPDAPPVLPSGGLATESLAVTGELSSPHGAVHLDRWLADAAAYLGKRQDLRDWSYDSLHHRFQLERGRYTIESLELTGPVDLRASGWVDLGGELSVATFWRLPPGFVPDLGAMSFLALTLRDADGRIGLGLDFNGRAADPQVSLKLGGGGRR